MQFRRFAGCPVCNLHLQSFYRRHDELEAAGIREVVVFHSSRNDLLDHAGHFPFPVIPDPGKTLYRRFGVESSWKAFLDPRAWPSVFLAVVISLKNMVVFRRPSPALFPQGGRYGLPADFLIAPDGRLIAVHYGAHVDDHWSVDDMLALVTVFQNTIH